MGFFLERHSSGYSCKMSGGAWLALKALPPALALNGIFFGNRYTYQWACLLVLGYFAEGTTRAWAELGLSRTLAAAEIVLALAFFAAAVSFARLARAGASPRRRAAPRSARRPAGRGPCPAHAPFRMRRRSAWRARDSA